MTKWFTGAALAFLMAGAALGAPLGEAVTPTVAGFDSGSAPVQMATPANSSHAAGTSVGGLFTLPAARIAGGQGEIGNLLWRSVGGSTGVLVIRIWDVSPAATTCTDNTAFVGSATDDKHLVATPFSITPAAPGSTTGDASTYATKAFTPPASFANQDSTPTPNIYVCAVTVATDTADENHAVYVDTTGPQD